MRSGILVSHIDPKSIAEQVVDHQPDVWAEWLVVPGKVLKPAWGKRLFS